MSQTAEQVGLAATLGEPTPAHPVVPGHPVVRIHPTTGQVSHVVDDPMISVR